MSEFCKCGSIKIYGVCSNRHCPDLNNSLDTWIIDGKEYNFKKPLTREEAEDAVKNHPDLIKYKPKLPAGSQTKPYVDWERG